MAVDIGALRTEIQTDPKGFYGSAIVEYDITKIFGAINLVRSGASYAVNRGKVLASDIFALIKGNDYETLTAAERDELLGVLAMDALDAGNATTVAIFQRIFAGTSTLTTLAAYRDREGSRAEVLFSESVSRTDIKQALVGA